MSTRPNKRVENLLVVTHLSASAPYMDRHLQVVEQASGSPAQLPFAALLCRFASSRWRSKRSTVETWKAAIRHYRRRFILYLSGGAGGAAASFMGVF